VRDRLVDRRGLAALGKRIHADLHALQAQFPGAQLLFFGPRPRPEPEALIARARQGDARARQALARELAWHLNLSREIPAPYAQYLAEALRHGVDLNRAFGRRASGRPDEFAQRRSVALLIDYLAAADGDEAAALETVRRLLGYASTRTLNNATRAERGRWRTLPGTAAQRRYELLLGASLACDLLLP
jgi:hypothetical protein